MSQEYPFPKPLDKSVLVCLDLDRTIQTQNSGSRNIPNYEWKQAPQDPERKYYLSSDNQDIDWRPVDFPEGEDLGQLLYWDPSAGPNGEGAWVLTDAPNQNGTIAYWNGQTWNMLNPPSGSALQVLTIQGGNIAWTPTQDCS